MTAAVLKSIPLAERYAAIDVLADRIVSGSGRLAAATCRWLLLVADFDARDGCARFGLATTSHWLAYACGISQRTATDHVRAARTLAAHARLAEEMSAGRLSYSHLRAISRVVRPDENALVEALLNVAEHGTVRQLEEMVRGLRTVRDNDEGGPPLEEYVKHGWASRTEHWRISARLDPERGAFVESAVAAVAQAEGLSRTDALVRLAEIALAALADAEHPPRTLRGEEQAAVVVHLDARGDAPPDRPRARLDGGPGLPAAVARRLSCTGRVRAAVHRRDGTLLDLGRSRRLVSTRQFRALLLRDRHCTHPGCRSRSGLEAHHVVHWFDGGRTDLANLTLLCRRHHHAHHDGAFTIDALGRQRFRFRSRDGRELSDYDRDCTGRPPVETEHADVARTAATPRWDGSRLDHHYAVAVLAQSMNPGERRPRERPIGPDEGGPPATAA